MTDVNSELDRLQKRGEMLANVTWAKFKTEGDSYEGTYIARQKGMAPSGNEQIIYSILTKNGVVNVGRRVNDSRIHNVMDEAKYGQVVRFVFVKTIPSKRAGFNDTKAVDVYTRPDILDMEWLKEQGATEGITPEPYADVEAAANGVLSALGTGFPTAAPSNTSAKKL